MPNTNESNEVQVIKMNASDILNVETVATLTRYYSAKQWRAVNGATVFNLKTQGIDDFTACIMATVQRQADSIRDADKVEKAVESAMEKRFNLVGGPEEQENACNKIDSIFSELPEELRTPAGKAFRRKLYGAKLGDSRVTPALANLLTYMNLPADAWE